ncbi:hypothetical protein, partial [Burkholderia ubonensis]|uniref:hypothetical protein n=1 Tax=Burkholderia ubonensis TaxID=101571 RepID=UPI001E543CE5
MAAEASATSYLDERLERLRKALGEIAKPAATGELPDVELKDTGLNISLILLCHKRKTCLARPQHGHCPSRAS